MREDKCGDPHSSSLIFFNPVKKTPENQYNQYNPVPGQKIALSRCNRSNFPIIQRKKRRYQ